MSIELIPALDEQRDVLANLFELYTHDFSEIVDVRLGDDGRFGYPHLGLYFEDPKRFPFLVRVDGALAGFVLVKRGSEVSGDEDVWDVAEMFVVRGARRRGVGQEVAHRIWARFPGRWEVRVMRANEAARPFWARAVQAFVGHAVAPTYVQPPGKRWDVFSFESDGRGRSQNG
jgi:predicted acetyltransferase